MRSQLCLVAIISRTLFKVHVIFILHENLVYITLVYRRVYHKASVECNTLSVVKRINGLPGSGSTLIGSVKAGAVAVRS